MAGRTLPETATNLFTDNLFSGTFGINHFGRVGDDSRKHRKMVRD
jgi:hypothetical protein